MKAKRSASYRYKAVEAMSDCAACGHMEHVEKCTAPFFRTVAQAMALGSGQICGCDVGRGLRDAAAYERGREEGRRAVAQEAFSLVCLGERSGCHTPGKDSEFYGCTTSHSPNCDEVRERVRALLASPTAGAEQKEKK